MPSSGSRMLATALALAASLALGSATAGAQQDALVIEKDAVRITTSLSVTGTAKAETFSGSFVGMGAMPVGAILMWSGAADKLPAGWLLCDGTKGTPPLSGRFIVGYDKSNLAEYDVNKTGGEAAHTLTVEEMPSHSHAATTGTAGEHQHDIRTSSHGWDYGGNRSKWRHSS